MTPEEKAKELVDRIEGVLGGSLPMGGEPYLSETKACALICVEEIIGSTPLNPFDSFRYYEFLSDRSDRTEEVEIFWQKVKEEIQKL